MIKIPEANASGFFVCYVLSQSNGFIVGNRTQLSHSVS